MKPYVHVVKYYETDRMGITHHSNYVRWMEEARIDFLEQLGLSYETLEKEGIFSPVTAVECKYKQSTTFPDRVCITVSVEKLSGVRLRFSYRMENEQGKLCCQGASEHCFVSREGRILRLDKEFPQFYQQLKSLEEKEDTL